MKKTITTLAIISLVLLSTLLFFVGCSDMMEKMGSISLTINLDTPEVTVASYTLEGALSNTRNSFTVNNVTPPKHTLSSLQKGNWNLTVTAFDESNNQIGVGTKTVVLEEGQVTDTTLLVVFGQNTPQLSTFTISAPGRYDVAQGTITGTTTSMEYKLASASEETAYTSCTAPITLLAPGIYKIRYAEAHGLEASEDLTFTIPAYQKVQLSISDPTLTTTKAYDGTAELSGSMKAGTLTNVINGDDVIVHAEASYDSPAVGNDKTITITYSLSGTDALNYIKPANTTKTGIIEKKQLTILGTSVECDKVYNGLSEAHLNIVGDLDGIIGSEVVSANATAAYYDKNVGTGKQITVTYSLTGENKGNYLPPVTNTSFTGEITRKALSVSYTTPPQPSKAYDGTNTAQIASDGTLGGVIDGDSVILQATATYTDENVGTDKQCMISYTLSGTDADNYSAPTRDSSSYTGKITKRVLTATVGDYTKIYGEENPVFTVYVTGFVTGENESLIGYSAPTASCSAEASTGVGTYDITISGGSASNYSFNTDDRGELTINKAILTATVGNYSKTYGEENPEFNVVVTGFVNGESAASLGSSYSPPTASSSATTSTNVGLSAITISGGSTTNNYIFNTNYTGTLTINKALLTGTVSISGDATYTKVLTVTGINQDWNPIYQWKRDGDTFSTTTQSTYTLTKDDIGKRISVTVTAGEGNYEGSITSSGTEPVVKLPGSPISGDFEAYYPNLPAETQTIINLTGFTANLTGLEAQVALNGTDFDEWGNLEIDSRGRAMILTDSDVTSTAKVKIRYAETSTHLAGAELQLDVSVQNLAIGDYYEGGVVAYIYSPEEGPALYVTDEVHGLIAAKDDISSTGTEWSNLNTSLLIGTQIAIGKGSENTDTIIATLDVNGESDMSYAAKKARSYTDGIYHDWFLPSWDELKKLYASKTQIGNFNTIYDTAYMSSSESTQIFYDPDSHFHVVFFDSRNPENHVVFTKLNGATNIRPVRYF